MLAVKLCNDCTNEFMGFCTLKACEYVKAIYEPVVIIVEPAVYQTKGDDDFVGTGYSNRGDCDSYNKSPFREAGD